MISYCGMIVFFYVCIFFFGMIWGSFLNAWEWRMRHNKHIASGRSACRDCNTQLKWYDNIPLVSFVLLRGKCRVCNAAISPQYPIVEVTVGFLFILVAWVHSVPAVADVGLFLRDIFLVFMLSYIFIYDLKYQEIPDQISLSTSAVLAIGGLVFGWLTWQSMTIGALIGAGFFLLQYVVSRGKWIGGGDIRLGLLMGVALGWPLTVVALFLAYVGGAVLSIPLVLARKKEMASAVPFGTYLTVATIVALWWGNDIMRWYMELIRF